MTSQTIDELIVKIKKAKTPYAVLGLEQNCTKQEIKKSYRELSKMIHPDKCQHECATECFQKVSTAHIILTDQGKRKKYDEGLSDDWKYNQKSSNENKNIYPIFTKGLFPNIISFEDDISPEEIISVLFGNLITLILTYFQRRFYSGKMRYDEENEEDAEINEENPKILRRFNKYRFCQSILYIIPIFISFFLIYKEIL